MIRVALFLLSLIMIVVGAIHVACTLPWYWNILILGLCISYGCLEW